MAKSTMSAAVIDTLKFADRLKAAGFEPPQAEGMARALGDELAERMITRRDLDEALQPIDVRFDSVDARFDAIDARFDAMDTKIDSVHRELSGKFNILVGVMALGFTLLAGLGGYNAVSPRLAQPIERLSKTPQETMALPSSPISQPLAEG